MHADAERLQFIYDRLVFKYGENPWYDYMQNIAHIIVRLQDLDSKRVEITHRQD